MSDNLREMLASRTDGDVRPTERGYILSLAGERVRVRTHWIWSGWKVEIEDDGQWVKLGHWASLHDAVPDVRQHLEDDGQIPPSSPIPGSNEWMDN